MSDDLVKFLRARLEDDEAWAAAVIPADKWWVVRVHVSTDLDPVRTRTQDAARTALASRFDAARVLREVEAKRAILNRHRPWPLDRWQVCSNCRPVDPEYPSDLTSVLWPCPDLRDAIAVYSNHPEYRQEWQP